ncbi:flagellar basal body-associated FliL family protein [Chromatiaceae bacterium AAb-1]|nr:flagellar basal body-associated FliL family protein [Chromatiaceae bacterium AAb-1]
MKTVLMAVAAIILVAVGVGGGLWYQEKTQGTNMKVVSTKPLFQPMERFVISISSEHNSRYLVLELALVTHDESVLPQLHEATPLLRNALVEHFSIFNHVQVKEAFTDVPHVQKALLDKFNLALRNNKFSYQIEQILITNVFIQ